MHHVNNPISLIKVEHTMQYTLTCYNTISKPGNITHINTKKYIIEFQFRYEILQWPHKFLYIQDIVQKCKSQHTEIAHYFVNCTDAAQCTGKVQGAITVFKKSYKLTGCYIKFNISISPH